MCVKKCRKVATYAVLIFFAILIIFPVFWMISVAVRPNIDVFKYPLEIIPKTFTFEAFQKVFTNPKLLRYMLNSCINSAIVTLIATAVGIMAGYGVSRYRFKGKGLFNTFVISTQTIPRVTLIIPFFLLMVTYKLYDTRLGLILAYISFALPYSIVMMVGYMNSVSTSLDEAARIDGASDFRTLWQVVVPVAVPGIVSAMTHTFIISWNEFVFATTLIRNDALRTIPVGIAMLKGEQSYEWNVLMAMSLVASVPVLVLYLLGQRYFISGLSSGGVKE